MRGWLVIALALESTALADTAADREEARREFSAGQAADAQRDWRTAIEHYLRANDLMPHPNAMFNIATNYERLGKLREAAVWYRRYLDAAPESADRTRTERALKELTLRTGTITVRSRTPGGQVSIDGVRVGPTPYSGHAKGGRHTIVVEWGERRAEREVDIEFGEPALVELERPAGRATVPAQPPSAPPGTVRITGQGRLSVDGQDVGELPLEVDLTPGEHRIHVARAGGNYERGVRVTAGTTITVDTQLAPPPPDERGARRFTLGAGGGLDAREQRGMFLLAVGMQYSGLEAVSRVGKVGDLTFLDLSGRWTLGDGRLAPFVIAGYSFVIADGSADDDASTGGAGYFVGGGLQLALSRGVALVAESGIRFYTAATAGDEADSSLIVPVLVSIQTSFR
jgi:hypothetical protein